MQLRVISQNHSRECIFRPMLWPKNQPGRVLASASAFEGFGGAISYLDEDVFVTKAWTFTAHAAESLYIVSACIPASIVALVGFVKALLSPSAHLQRLKRFFTYSDSDLTTSF